MSNIIPRHPAKYTDKFIPIFADLLKGKSDVLDPFAGTGKLGLIKDLGFRGKVYCNEIEREWLEPNQYNCDVLTYEDAEFLEYPTNFFEAICTSPTYGNRMADHHQAKDGSKRNTYTHCLGHTLNDENTGKMQFGSKYCDKHSKIYRHLVTLLKEDGIFILNVSNHIRKGKEVDVSQWHKEELLKCGLKCIKELNIHTQRLKYGSNSNLRVETENIYVFVKPKAREQSGNADNKE